MGDGLEVKIDSQAVRELVGEAILAQIGEEQKQAILQQAVNNLLEQPKNSYGSVRGESPLQIAFNTAVREVSFGIVKDWLARPENETTVRAALEDALGKFMQTNYLYGALGDSIAKVIEQKIDERVGSYS